MNADDDTVRDGATDTAVGYRPVSGLAVAAAVAGLAASLAVVSPLFAMLPLVGIALAAAAIADVDRAGARKAGGWAALVGLALSIGCGAQAASSVLVSRWIGQRRAVAAASIWLEAIGDRRLADAASMCAPAMFTSGAAPAGAEAALAALPGVAAATACTAVAAASATEDPSGEGWAVRLTLRSCAEAPDRRPRLVVRVVPAPASGPRGPVERWTVTGVDVDG